MAEKTYKVTEGQNIWDVALKLFGTIEGIYDLMVSNAWLGTSTDLKAGDVLVYHDSFVVNKGVVDEINNNGYACANGERHTFYKESSLPLIAVVRIDQPCDSSKIAVFASGEIQVDWGDNSPMEDVMLLNHEWDTVHYYDTEQDSRLVKIYGDAQFERIDLTGLNGRLYLVDAVTVDILHCSNSDCWLGAAPLFRGLAKAVLRNCSVQALQALSGVYLNELDLRGAEFAEDELYGYLTGVCNEYGNRCACTVWLDKMPQRESMKVIYRLMTEEEWNSPVKWKFVIDGTAYDKDNPGVFGEMDDTNDKTD